MGSIVILAGYIFCIFGGSFIVSLLCRLVNFPEVKDSEVKRAGMLIGFFERFIVLTFALLAQYSAIAFIFTAKSIARFKELEDRNFAEYYLIGTLASVSFAIFCGLIMKFLLKNMTGP